MTIFLSFYCLLNDAPYADIAILYNTHDFKTLRYERNEKLETYILQRVLDFWENLQKGIAPEAVNIDDIRLKNSELYKMMSNEKCLTLQSKDKLFYDLQEYQEKSAHIKELTKELEEKRLEIDHTISDYQRVEDDHNKTLLTYRFSKTREVCDVGRLRKEFPEVWEQVKKETTASRRLIIK